MPPVPIMKCHQSLLLFYSDATPTSVASLSSAFSMDVTLPALGLCWLCSIGEQVGDEGFLDKALCRSSPHLPTSSPKERLWLVPSR